jgi:hypothetical protein
MDNRIIRRAAGAAIATVLLSAAAVFADTVPAYSDAVTPGPDGVIDLGQAGPGQEIDTSVWFSLTCAGTSHAVPNSTIRLNLSGGTVPDDGAATVTGTTIGPVPTNWPAAGQDCPRPAPELASNGPSAVTLRVPTTPGNDYEFTLMWSRDGTTGLTGFTTMTFRVDVVPNTPPLVIVPVDQIVEATGPSGAVVSFSATAIDAEDAPPPTPTCTALSGSTFPLGDTTVTCSATDSGGLTDSDSFHVIVVDTTDPTLVGLPDDRTIRTNDPSGATLTYTPPTATDAVDPSPTVVCDPASGSTIPVGATSVTCTATDASGNDASASFQANVILNTAPQLTVPSDKTAEATGPAGAVVTFSATATDVEDATAPTPTCAPSSGSTFALGTTTVNCRVTDDDGLSDSGSFQVTVVDTTAPVMPRIADFELTTTDPSGATLEYGYVSVFERVDPSPTVVCLPANGTKIPVGTTTVTCTATDASGNQSTMSFHVTVTLLSSSTWSAVWGEPLAPGTDTFAVNGNRSIPVKVEIFANGVEQTGGHAVLSVVACGGGTPLELVMSFDSGRWNAKLDTSRLAGPGCYTLTASLDGHPAGSVRLDLRGDTTTPTKGPAKAKP